MIRLYDSYELLFYIKIRNTSIFIKSYTKGYHYFLNFLPFFLLLVSSTLYWKFKKKLLLGNSMDGQNGTRGLGNKKFYFFSKKLLKTRLFPKSEGFL